jgi:adenosylcobyric acid synthase
MFQGTGSDVGKSLVVAGLARAFAGRGLRVRPFKPQNMSNNAAVTVDGGEIGRAQALQARACFALPVADMNPVLLKPQSETGAQIVVQGRVEGAAKAADYHALKPRLMPRVLESFERLGAAADLVLVEGAGSAAEANLRANDIANMGFARAAHVPVLLVGDIDRGGVIASLVGTHALLDRDDRALLAGYLINKFRGDPTLFQPALHLIFRRTGLDCLGIVRHLNAARDLPPEDAMALDALRDAVAANGSGDGARVKIVVPRLPRIANFDDLDALRGELGVELEIVPPGRALPGDAALVLLPGSKATLADLAALRVEGWDIDIRAHWRRGGRVLGLCGGYQMLGRRIADPDGIEGIAGEAPGLGLLDVETVLAPEKTLRRSSGRAVAGGEHVEGYEIHLGRTEGADCGRPFLELEGRREGAVSADGRVAGCYLHGLFDSGQFRTSYLAGLGVAARERVDQHRRVEHALDAIAAHLTEVVDLDRILEIAHER